MTESNSIMDRAIGILTGAALILALYSFSTTNYLLFHSFAELFSIIVAFSIFLISWNSKRFLDNGYLLILGVSALFVGSIDLMHTLAYKGMGVFPGSDANLPTQLWIAARYLQSLSFLVAPLFLTRKVNVNALILVYGLVTGFIFATIFSWGIFPDSFLEGSGLTPFKIISEYIIAAILGLSLLILVMQRRYFPPNVVSWLVIALGASIASELAFTEYVSVYGPANMLGHLLKILAFFMIYRAIVETGFRKPVSLLFTNLKRNEDALLRSQEILEQKIHERTLELIQANQGLENEVESRKRTEAELTLYKQDLEGLVEVRTAALQNEVAQRTRIQQALIESQERMSLATEAANIGTWDIAPTFSELIWSEEASSLFGVPPAPQISYPEFLRLIHPDDRARIDQNIREALKHQKKFEAEYRIERPDGSLRWILAKGRGFYDEQGAPQRLIGTFMDVTRRKETEEKIQKNALRLQTLAELSKMMALSRHDDRGVIERVAQNLSTVLGDLCLIRIISNDSKSLELEAASHPDPEARRMAQELVKATFQSPAEGASARVIQEGQVIFLPKTSRAELQGKLRPEYSPYFEKYGVSALMIVPLHMQGNVIGTMTMIRNANRPAYTEDDLAFLQDIAERTAITLANRRLFRQLEHELNLRKRADATLKTYMKELARSNRELQDFVSIASHDLQEPLRKVQAFGERLKMKYATALSEEGLDYLNRMQNASSRMQVMLNDLLDFSRVTTKAQPLVPVNLNEILTGVISDLEIRIEETDGQVRVDPLPTIDADPLQMRQLFQNLIGNALKFHRPEVPPVLQIHARPLEEFNGEPAIEITVQDNGIGFDEKYLDQIFKPFLRLHSREQFAGTGMGLAICQKIVERHNGRITAYSQPGAGSTFVITLPQRQSVAAQAEQSAAAAS